MESIKKFEVWAGPLVYLVFGGMVWWAIDIAGGLGPIYSQPGKFPTFSETLVRNIQNQCRPYPDNARHSGGKRPKRFRKCMELSRL